MIESLARVKQDEKGMNESVRAGKKIFPGGGMLERKLVF